jgi:hypothetical protein
MNIRDGYRQSANAQDGTSAARRTRTGLGKSLLRQWTQMHGTRVEKRGNIRNTVGILCSC